MRKEMISIPVVIIMTLILSGCTESTRDEEEVLTPEDAILDMFTAIDEGDYERWVGYIMLNNGSFLAENETRKEEQINSMIVQLGRNGELIEVEILSMERIKVEEINNDHEPYIRYMMSIEFELLQEGNVSRSTEDFAVCHFQVSDRWGIGYYDEGDGDGYSIFALIDVRLSPKSQMMGNR